MFRQKEFRATPSAQLRELLDQLEVLIGKLKYEGLEEARKIPVLFDAADALMKELAQSGVPLQAETVRFESLTALFRRKAKLFLRKLGGAEALIVLRREHNPDAGRWWWFIEQWLKEQAALQRRRQVKVLLIGAVILAVLAGVYALFLRPDPLMVEVLRRQQAAEELARTRDYQAALREINAALELTPTNPSLLTLKGIMQAQLGLKAEAATTFAAAEAATENREQFLLLRAQTYLSIDMPAAALIDATAAIALNPQSGRGYLFLGQANANMGNLLEAQRQYEEAARLATEAQDVELEAMARVQLAYLYQGMLAVPPTATPKP